MTKITYSGATMSPEVYAIYERALHHKQDTGKWPTLNTGPEWRKASAVLKKETAQPLSFHVRKLEFYHAVGHAFTTIPPAEVFENLDEDMRNGRQPGPDDMLVKTPDLEGLAHNGTREPYALGFGEELRFAH